MRITGASTDKIDLVLTPGVVLRQGQVDPFFTNPYTGPAEFGRKAVDLIVNGYFANNVFSSYLGEFNFYYNMTEGTRTMRFDPGNCQLYNDFAYNANTAFTDVGGIIFREYNRGSCVETDPGLAYVREYAEGADVRTGPPRTFWIREDYAYSSLLHESGHATFGLREEYCPGAKEDLNYHSNVFDSLDRCIGLSADPNRAQNCRQVHADCSPMRWRADPADDPMTLTTSGKQYGPDCQRRAQCIIDATPQADCR